MNRFLILMMIFSLACYSSIGQGTNHAYERNLLIEHIHLLPMDSPEVLRDMQVWLREGKIFKIGKKLDYPLSGKKIDGKGQYLMPGLTEMHAHIPLPQGADDGKAEEAFFLWMANGITTIRGMLGHPRHLTYRERAAQEAGYAPRIFTSGPSINGNSAPSAAIATRMVREQKEAGYDFLKLHPGLKRAVFDSLVRVANQVEIPFAGHVSVDVGVRHAIESGYASIDHIDGYVEGLVPAEKGLIPGSGGFFGFNFTDEVDEHKLDALVSLTKAHRVAVVPTHSLMVSLAHPSWADSLHAMREMDFVSRPTLQQWKQTVYGFQASRSYEAERGLRYLALRDEILRKLKTAKVPILLGSDAPQIYNVPGFSIHHEMQAMLKAGFSPYEILYAGTVAPARFLGQAGKFGQIVEGGAADLIWLETNPLEDLTTLKNPVRVCVRGAWLEREEIFAGLEKIRTKYRK
ncbi:MAG: amidohydrolase family protein [Bacteroidota bacterium]